MAGDAIGSVTNTTPSTTPVTTPEATTPRRKVSPEAMKVLRSRDVDFSGGPLSPSEQAALRAVANELLSLTEQNEQGETALDYIDIPHDPEEIQSHMQEITQYTQSNVNIGKFVPTVNNMIKLWKDFAAKADPDFDFSKIENLIREYGGEDEMFSNEELCALYNNETISVFQNAFFGIVGIKGQISNKNNRDPQSNFN